MLAEGHPAVCESIMSHEGPQALAKMLRSNVGHARQAAAEAMQVGLGCLGAHSIKARLALLCGACWSLFTWPTLCRHVLRPCPISKAAGLQRLQRVASSHEIRVLLSRAQPHAPVSWRTASLAGCCATRGCDTAPSAVGAGAGVSILTQMLCRKINPYLPALLRPSSKRSSDSSAPDVCRLWRLRGRT